MEDKRERIDIVETLDPNEISNTQLKKLTEELAETKNGELRNALAIKLLEVAELGEQEIKLEPVLRTITLLADKKHIATLLWFCSHFDCSEHIELFTRVVIENDSDAYMEALNVFESMQSPVSVQVRDEVVAKLLAYNNTLPADHFKKEIIPELVEVIGEMPVVK